MSADQTPPRPPDRPAPTPDWESHTTAGGSRGVPEIEDTPREQAPPPAPDGDPDAPPMAVTPGDDSESEAPAPPPAAPS
jgi:hypothetical protein